MLYKLPRKKLGDVVAITQKLSFSGNHDNKPNVCQTLIHYESNKLKQPFFPLLENKSSHPDVTGTLDSSSDISIFEKVFLIQWNAWIWLTRLDYMIIQD